MSQNHKGFYRCGCYLQRNFYIAELNLHVNYCDEDSFLKHNAEHLKCMQLEQRKKILLNIKEEYMRRVNIDSDARLRGRLIQQQYVPRFKEVYELKECYLDDEFIRLVEHAKAPGSTSSSILRLLKREKAPEVYRMKVFTGDFCEKLLLELDHFNQTSLPKGRPNTMNNSGILLDEVGFYEKFITPLREKYLNCIAGLLYPDWVGDGLDSHKAFTVQYKENGNVDLAQHYDNAEVTLNVCLGKDFDDGILYFGGMRKTQGHSQPSEVEHVTGEGILHRGQQVHGAMPITFGERVNLIVWMRSSSVRNKLCPMCDNTPDLVSSCGFGDGFTDGGSDTVQMCSLH